MIPLHYCMEMIDMKRIILDGRYMKNKELTHLYLKEKLETYGYYGENLDALWDILSTYSYPVEIKLINEYRLIESLGDYGKSILEVFKDAQEENHNIKFTIIDWKVI